MTDAVPEWWYLGSPVAARTHGSEDKSKKGRRLASSVNDEDMRSLESTSDPAARAAPDWDAEATRQIEQADSERPPTPGSRVALRNAVIDAARAFVEWHLKGQAGRPGTLYPMTYAQLDTWHDERDKRFSALAEAVEALNTSEGETA